MFEPGSLFASLVIGAIGLGLFLFGKRQKRFPQILVGLTLMVFPYFVPSVLWMVVVALGLVVGLNWVAVRAGL